MAATGLIPSELLCLHIDDDDNICKYLAYLKISHRMGRDLTESENIFLFGSPFPPLEEYKPDLNLSEFMIFLKTRNYISKVYPMLYIELDNISCTEHISTVFGAHNCDVLEKYDTLGGLVEIQFSYDPSILASAVPIGSNSCVKNTMLVFKHQVYEPNTSNPVLVLASHGSNDLFYDIGNIVIYVEVGPTTLFDYADPEKLKIITKTAVGCFKILTNVTTDAQLIFDDRSSTEILPDLLQLIMGSSGIGIPATSVDFRYKIIASASIIDRIDLREIEPRRVHTTGRFANYGRGYPIVPLKPLSIGELAGEYWCVTHDTPTSTIYRNTVAPTLICLPKTDISNQQLSVEPLDVRPEHETHDISLHLRKWKNVPDRYSVLLDGSPGSSLSIVVFRTEQAKKINTIHNPTRFVIHECRDMIFRNSIEINVTEMLINIPRLPCDRILISLYETMYMIQDLYDTQIDFLFNDIDNGLNIYKFVKTYMMVRDMRTNKNWKFSITLTCINQSDLVSVINTFGLFKPDSCFNVFSWSDTAEKLMPVPTLLLNVDRGVFTLDGSPQYTGGPTETRIRIIKSTEYPLGSSSLNVGLPFGLEVSPDINPNIQLIKKTDNITNRVMLSGRPLIYLEKNQMSSSFVPVFQTSYKTFVEISEETATPPYDTPVDDIEYIRDYPALMHHPTVAPKIFLATADYKPVVTEAWKVGLCLFHFNYITPWTRIPNIGQPDTISTVSTQLVIMSKRERITMTVESGEYYDQSIRRLCDRKGSGNQSVLTTETDSGEYTVMITGRSQQASTWGDTKDILNSIILKLHMLPARLDHNFSQYVNRPTTQDTMILETHYDESVFLGSIIQSLSGTRVDYQSARGIEAKSAIRTFYGAMHPNVLELPTGAVVLDYELNRHNTKLNKVLDFLIYVSVTTDVTRTSENVIIVNRHRGASGWYKPHDMIPTDKTNFITRLLCMDDYRLHGLMTRAMIPVLFDHSEFTVEHSAFGSDEIMRLLLESYSRHIGQVYIFSNLETLSVSTTIGKLSGLTLIEKLDPIRGPCSHMFFDSGYSIVLGSDSPIFVMDTGNIVTQNVGLTPVVVQDTRFRTNADGLSDDGTFEWPELPDILYPKRSVGYDMIYGYYKNLSGHRDIMDKSLSSVVRVNPRTDTSIPITVEKYRDMIVIPNQYSPTSMTFPDIKLDPISSTIGDGGTLIVYDPLGPNIADVLIQHKKYTLRSKQLSKGFTPFVRRIILGKTHGVWTRGLMFVQNFRTAHGLGSHKTDGAGFLLIPDGTTETVTVIDRSSGGEVISNSEYVFKHSADQMSLTTYMMRLITTNRRIVIECHMYGLYAFINKLLCSISVLIGPNPKTITLYTPEGDGPWLTDDIKNIDRLITTTDFLPVSAVGSTHFKRKIYNSIGVTESLNPTMYIYESMTEYKAVLANIFPSERDFGRRHYVDESIVGSVQSSVSASGIGLTITDPETILNTAKQDGLTINIVGPDVWTKPPWEFSEILESDSASLFAGEEFCECFDHNTMPEYLTDAMIRQRISIGPTERERETLLENLPTQPALLGSVNFPPSGYEEYKKFDTTTSYKFISEPPGYKFVTMLNKIILPAVFPIYIGDSIILNDIRVELVVGPPKTPHGGFIEFRNGDKEPIPMDTVGITGNGSIYKNITYNIENLWGELCAMTRCAGVYPMFEYSGEVDVIYAIKLYSIFSILFLDKTTTCFNKIIVNVENNQQLSHFTENIIKPFAVGDTIYIYDTEGQNNRFHSSLTTEPNWTVFVPPGNPGIIRGSVFPNTAPLTALYDHMLKAVSVLSYRSDTKQPVKTKDFRWLGLLKFLELNGLISVFKLREELTQQLYIQNYTAAEICGRDGSLLLV